MKYHSRKDRRQRRHRRVRRKIRGTPDRPRMAIMISNRHQYVQFIDDERGVTLASAGTLGLDEVRNNVAAARILGRRAAEAAMARGIRRVVVDRGGFRFHGRLKAIVDAAVEAGLQIRGADETASEVGRGGEEPAREAT